MSNSRVSMSRILNVKIRVLWPKLWLENFHIGWEPQKLCLHIRQLYTFIRVWMYVVLSSHHSLTPPFSFSFKATVAKKTNCIDFLLEKQDEVEGKELLSLSRSQCQFLLFSCHDGTTEGCCFLIPTGGCLEILKVIFNSSLCTIRGKQ